MSGVSSLNRRLILKLLNSSGNPPIRFTLSSGEQVASPQQSPVAGVIFRDPRIFLKFLCRPNVYFGEGYETGRIEVEGDLVRLLETIAQAMGRLKLGRWLREPRRSPLIGKLKILPRKNGIKQSRHNIHRHYDIDNDFYKLWLDERLLYTCAYFASPDDDLETAQIKKMDLVCRKVGLRPGESVAEAGCGWGALALYMARHYGVTVKAFNISHEQILYAREQATEQGLQSKVEFIEDDYRNITGRFDAFVSVGMLEHVGVANYPELGRVIDRSLTDKGRGLLHFIGRNQEIPLNRWITQRIFPGAEPPTIRQAMQIFEVPNFSVLDLENLRLHYARTLQHWLDRFENSADIVHRMFGENFVRAWRLYLAGSLASFRTGWLQLFQITFARACDNRIQWTRAPLYRTEFLEQEASHSTSTQHANL